jgi:hypothetical protein
MGHDKITPGLHTEFQNMIVLRIFQEWPPEKMNFAPATYTADVISNVVNVGVGHPNLPRDTLRRVGGSTKPISKTSPGLPNHPTEPTTVALVAPTVLQGGGTSSNVSTMPIS